MQCVVNHTERYKMARIKSSKRQLIPNFNIEGIQKIGRSKRRSQIFMNYLNVWADYNIHEETSKGQYRTPYGDGYQQAVRDIWNNIELEKRQKKNSEVVE